MVSNRPGSEANVSEKAGLREPDKSRSLLSRWTTWSFLIGVVIAVVVGMAIGTGYIEPLNSDEAGETEGIIASFLVILGLLIGIFSALGMGTIKKESIPPFLTATVALLAVGIGATQFGKIPYIGDYFSGITGSMLVFFAPVAVILAMKILIDIGHE
jgi:predicted MFS family arabinose efflux permease